MVVSNRLGSHAFSIDDSSISTVLRVFNNSVQRSLDCCIDRRHCITLTYRIYQYSYLRFLVIRVIFYHSSWSIYSVWEKA
jgi:hypothetical protein